MIKPQIPKGWRRVRVGSLRKHGDKFWSNGQWHTTTMGGFPQCWPNFTYIRKIKKYGTSKTKTD